MFRANAVEKFETRFNNFYSEYRVYEILRKNMIRARQATGDSIIRRMIFLHCITKATDTHPEYVIRIAFPRQ